MLRQLFKDTRHHANILLVVTKLQNCKSYLLPPNFQSQFSVYAPTLQAELAEKDKFYSELRILPQGTPADDKLLVLGDFNARVGQDAVTWKGILGRHGVGNCNDNRRLLLEFCMEQQLVITNTIFQQKDSLETTWMHPRSKHWHLIDYVLARAGFRP